MFKKLAQQLKTYNEKKSNALRVTSPLAEEFLTPKNEYYRKISQKAVELYEKQSQLRIRRLTPREAFRLIGVKDEDFERVAKNQSKSSLYHLAGDSIITNCLMAIFKEML